MGIEVYLLSGGTGMLVLVLVLVLMLL